VTMTHAGTRTTMHIAVDVAATAADDSDRTSPVTALCDDLAMYQIVLTSGRFVSADGFTLSDDRTTAMPVEITDDELELELELTWDDH
jgi:hypothetical protein